jgi:rubredoxin
MGYPKHVCLTASLTSFDNHSATLYSIKLKAAKSQRLPNFMICGGIYRPKAPWRFPSLEIHLVCPKCGMFKDKKYRAIEEL